MVALGIELSAIRLSAESRQPAFDYRSVADFGLRIGSARHSAIRNLQSAIEPVGREALESSSAAFQATAKPSQLPARFSAGDSVEMKCRACHFVPRRNKKTRCLATPGLRWEIPQGLTGVTSVTDARADYSPVDRRNRPGVFVRICFWSLNASWFVSLYSRDGRSPVVSLSG